MHYNPWCYLLKQVWTTLAGLLRLRQDCLDERPPADRRSRGKAYTPHSRFVLTTIYLSMHIYKFIQVRVLKSPAEVEILQKVNDVASDAHLAVMHHAKPGMAEFQLEVPP